MFGGFAAIIVAAVVAVVIRQTCLKETPASFFFQSLFSPKKITRTSFEITFLFVQREKVGTNGKVHTKKST